MWVGYIGIRFFFVIYVALHKTMYRYFSNGLNILRFIFYICSMYCDVPYNIRRYVT